MPRRPRDDAPGATHHVIVRGIERGRIFVDDRDRAELLRRLERVLPECGTRCYAWAFLPNHAHLVLRTGSVPLAVVMARLGTGYATYFNRRHGRAGHLFQNRYHSIHVDEDEYLRVLIRYVHRNPLRAGLVSDLASLSRYPWTGHAVLMGERTARFQDLEFVLAHFGSDRRARSRLEAWMEQEAPDRPSAKPRSPDAELRRLVEDVAGRLGVDARAIRLGWRAEGLSRARAEIARRARHEPELPLAEIGRALGISDRGAARAIERGRHPPGAARGVSP
jgi:REP element-mobilizing transposase RayT